MRGSMSLSKIAEDDECTDVGDEGIDAGDLVPIGCVRRCCDVRFESLLSFGEAVKFVFEVTWRRSELAMAVGAVGLAAVS